MFFTIPFGAAYYFHLKSSLQSPSHPFSDAMGFQTQVTLFPLCFFITLSPSTGVVHIMYHVFSTMILYWKWQNKLWVPNQLYTIKNWSVNDEAQNEMNDYEWVNKYRFIIIDVVGWLVSWAYVVLKLLLLYFSLYWLMPEGIFWAVWQPLLPRHCWEGNE